MGLGASLLAVAIKERRETEGVSAVRWCMIGAQSVITKSPIATHTILEELLGDSFFFLSPFPFRLKSFFILPLFLISTFLLSNKPILLNVIQRTLLHLQGREQHCLSTKSKLAIENPKIRTVPHNRVISERG